MQDIKIGRSRTHHGVSHPTATPGGIHAIQSRDHGDPSSEPIHVLVIHEVRLLADLIADIVERQADMVVIGHSTNLDDAATCLAVHRCDVVVANRSDEFGDIMAWIAEIVPASELPKVVIMALSNETPAIVDTIAAGISGYVLETDSADDLLAVIRRAHLGEALISPEVAYALFRQLANLASVARRYSQEKTGFVQLTHRESEVLQLIAEGKNNREIADQLVVEVGTVKNHVHRILEKYDLHSRKDAALLWCMDRKTQVG